MSTMTIAQYRYTAAKAHPSARYVWPVVDAALPDPAAHPRLLDVGSGSGAFAGRLCDRGFAVTGFDPAMRGVELAREAFPDAHWEVGEASPGVLSRLHEEPFDVVTSIEVVEHVYAPREWARCCFEACKPGGVFVCSTPYHGYLKNLALAVTGKWATHLNPLWDGGHIKFFHRHQLEALLREVGFTDLTFRGAGRYPGLWKSMIITARKPG
ncbi:MAG: class I SAM-dependent methyltransferase [Phycisphaerales bacterium]|jgi:2-polyprenyl-6-hydroxyphenyl methylase/3-demethylubiquinone-9 3-methyltransferase|nr:class I SAM-dependent methyltransferase [Phycisphaerales bacterium]